MIKAIRLETRLRRAQSAAGLLAAPSWNRSAAAHLPVYQQLAEFQHA
jgi:hypothetical protein